MIRRTSILGLALVISTLMGTSPAQAEGPRPFKSRVVATWDNVLNAFTPEGANFLGYGLTTHMGRAIQEGNLVLIGAPDASGDAPGIGSVTLTASNGDQVTFNYIGTLNVLTGVGVGTFVFTEGTGRFANVTGGGEFYALIDLSQLENQAMTVDLDGSIQY